MCRRYRDCRDTLYGPRDSVLGWVGMVHAGGQTDGIWVTFSSNANFRRSGNYSYQLVAVACCKPLKVVATLSRVSEIAARRTLSRMCEPRGWHDLPHELKFVCLSPVGHWCSLLCYLRAIL